MKINRKIVIAVVIIIAAIILGISSIRTRWHSGSDLNFSIGSGLVTVTNTSDLPVAVELVANRSFNVSSSNDEVSGSSRRNGSGSNATQIFSFMVSSGVTEFSVEHGTNVSFIAAKDTQLEVAVQPFDTNTTRIRFSVAVVAILGSLFYISSTNDHRWISAARRVKANDQAAEQETERQNFQRILDGRSSKEF